ncbi:hypothetical protein Lrub_2304 [Legionella rubrilucens]|uniref:MAE-28990/MAE-18760-like HEPN domain-containing protein n=1 Tax=Legionella rubrilucens TaxID=458 RepID=A0A0W0XM02_9GAMM|nr:hypothetical protein [Legionella rubrilucens]KTD45507.1 hypothetical protein Lrub_2304 [Legionella rubrilucens]
MTKEIITDPNDARKVLQLWSQEVNLNNIVNFHNVTKALIEQEVNRLSLLSQQEDDPKELELQKKIFQSALHNYNEYLTDNVFLMMYSHVEEWLFIHADSDTDTGGSLERFERSLVMKGLNTSSSEWQSLLRAEKIRNCLLHANGRLSFIKASDKACITQIIGQSRYFGSKNDRIIIKKHYLQYVKNQVAKLFKQLSK